MMCWYLLPLPRASKLLSTPTPSGPKQLFSYIVTGPPPFSCSLSELELHSSGFECRLSVAALGKSVHICDPYFLHL